jgi:hypothetical protein
MESNSETGNMGLAELVTISKAQYDAMKKRLAWLNALEAAGVDSWDGYEFAKETFIESNPEFGEE